MKNMLNKIKCLLRGHVEPDKNAVLTRIYTEEPCGAFYRSHRYVYGGRLYKCKRCGALIHVHGILFCEAEELVIRTLVGLPPLYFEDLWNNQDYEFCRIYKPK